MSRRKRILVGMMSLCLLFVPSWYAFAEPAEETGQETAVVTEETIKEPITISSVEEFLAFAENCRLDSYSQGLTVTLKSDIDLTGERFAGIPTFRGVFEGNGYSITGVVLTEKGSAQGLFRYLEQDGVIRNLNVYGEIMPTGSHSKVGGIVGCNRGEIENCGFFGLVAGVDAVGGIAGYNEVTGLIRDAYTEGEVYGNHFIGGIVGENKGVVWRCTNHSRINTKDSQNNIEISDITLETLMGAESATAVTDIGGIAGMSQGIIRECINHGNVGYPSMGYNIGGIAGSQTGYTVGCTNYGDINGRKEVGGIIGQMEPASLIRYEEDTLQILNRQLVTMREIMDRVETNTESSLNGINNQISVLRGNMSDAQAALDLIMKEVAKLSNDQEESDESTDMDQLSTALGQLTSSVNALKKGVDRLLSLTQNAGSVLRKDMEALSSQMDAISGTLEGASDYLGGSVVDVSDRDTEEDQTCKVEACVNHGTVSADINVGGIAGAIALENDQDPEDDLEISGEESLNFSGEFRAVISDCRNDGVITAKKMRVGGVVGRMTLGLVKDSQNRGLVNGVTADYVGGIAGESAGYIRRCDVKARIIGVDDVGGIAGVGKVVSDCRTMVSIAGEERVGTVLGYTEEPMFPESERVIVNNLYLSVGTDVGAIDGISYSGAAQSMDREAFLELEGLPEDYGRINVWFLNGSDVVEQISVETGGCIDAEQIPRVPEKKGFVGYWADSEGSEPGEMLSQLLFDLTFEAVYVSKATVIQSEQTDESGRPLLLAEGVFYDKSPLQLKKLEKLPRIAEGEAVIGGWEIILPDESESTTMRYLIPEEYRDKEVKLMIRLTGRVWNEEPFTVDGSYMVFTADAEDDAFCLVEIHGDYTWIWYGAGAFGVVVLLGIIIGFNRRKKRK